MKRGILALIVILAAGVAPAVGIKVEFSSPTGLLKKAIHSSGWAPRSSVRAIQNDDESVRSMGLEYARTHDWALVNAGQRVVDYQYIFPLWSLDAKDPASYCFGPTDRLLSLARNVGLKIFYRLGTSIEHTGKVHFNAAIPKDLDKAAEIFAGIVRHYNEGWADGFHYGIEYWEIWNEPDGCNNMWSFSGKDDFDPEVNAERTRLFVEFFVKSVKRLKAEFPSVKVGGPALCGMKPAYFTRLLDACRASGVSPDFISWHYYGSDVDQLLKTVYDARKLCDEKGFPKTELIINEYHYLLSWDGINGCNSTSAMVRRALDGPTGHNNIDSACFYLTALSLFQQVPLDQAYWYGCAHVGNWGYMDNYKQYNKIYHAAKMFGKIARGYPSVCDLRRNGTLTALAVASADGCRKALLLTDYRGVDQVLDVGVRGLDVDWTASATVLDDGRDGIPVSVDRSEDGVRIVKADKNSAAYLIEFQKNKSNRERTEK